MEVQWGHVTGSRTNLTSGPENGWGPNPCILALEVDLLLGFRPPPEDSHNPWLKPCGQVTCAVSHSFGTVRN